MTSAAAATSSRLPVVVLTGFLGAGKTTLLNKWLEPLAKDASNLENRKIKRIALIENEFASAFGVAENELLPSHGHESVSSLLALQEIYEFGFGCVCCSSSGELKRVLNEIAVKQGLVSGIEDPFSAYGDIGATDQAAAKASAEPLDLVILETTGLADPGPVADVLLMDSGISSSFDLLGVVGVVDSDRVYRDLVKRSANGVKEQDDDAGVPFKNEPLAQLLGSDVLVFSKTDLLPAKDSTQPNPQELLETYIAENRPGFPGSHVFYAARGEGAPDLDSLVDLLAQPRDRAASGGDPRPHDPAVTHIPLISPSTNFISPEKLAEGLQAFEKEHPGLILRVKGFLRTKSNPDRKLLLHGVGDRQLTFELGRGWAEEEGSLPSTVTVIGRDVGKFRKELGTILEAAKEA